MQFEMGLIVNNEGFSKMQSIAPDSAVLRAANRPIQEPHAMRIPFCYNHGHETTHFTSIASRCGAAPRSELDFFSC